MGMGMPNDGPTGGIVKAETRSEAEKPLVESKTRHYEESTSYH